MDSCVISWHREKQLPCKVNFLWHSEKSAMNAFRHTIGFKYFYTLRKIYVITDKLCKKENTMMWHEMTQTVQCRCMTVKIDSRYSEILQQRVAKKKKNNIWLPQRNVSRAVGAIVTAQPINCALGYRIHLLLCFQRQTQENKTVIYQTILECVPSFFLFVFIDIFIHTKGHWDIYLTD